MEKPPENELADKVSLKVKKSKVLEEKLGLF